MAPASPPRLSMDLPRWCPAWARPFLRRWIALGEWIGRWITAPLLFTLLWWLAFVPLGLARRWFARSPMCRDPAAPSYWHPVPVESPEVARARLERQF
jgi:hypothetical protein